MIQPDTLALFALAQKKLLIETYDKAWHAGAGNHGGQKPPGPDELRRALALALAFASVNKMAHSLGSLTPSVANQQAAADAVAAGTTSDESRYAMQQALNDWVDQNAYRFAGGESVAWAGEQAGYAEAASVAGDLLDWDDTGDDHECEDCQVLATMGPLPLEEWPTTPGAGGTECSVGCRCSMSAVSVPDGADDAHDYPLTTDQQTTANKVINARSGALDQLMPDMALLS